MGSAFYGALFDYAAKAYDRETALRDVLHHHGHQSVIALRLGGAAHFRALRGDAPEIAAHYPSTGGSGDPLLAWHAIVADVRDNTSTYHALLARPVQTNEVARSVTVLGAMLTVSDATGMPLRIYEIGSSAGLILNFDRYHYLAGDWTWGNPDSGLTLDNPFAQNDAYRLEPNLTVAERRGCDLHPLSAANAADRDTLLGFVWPDQRERFERLRKALRVAQRYPVAIDAADGTEWLEKHARPQPGAATVALHTVVTQHMPPPIHASFIDAVANAGRRATKDAPFAWARMELTGEVFETSVTLWPGGREISVARSDGHAQPLRNQAI